MRRIIKAVDLFCGAGGTSTGLLRACDKMGFTLDLFAVNHWDIAIATHSANHPDAKHMCASIDSVDPKEAIPGGRLGYPLGLSGVSALFAAGLRATSRIQDLQAKRIANVQKVLVGE